MKIKKKQFIIILFLPMLIGLSDLSYACSLIKITKNGRTVVGNNEDQMNPNTRIWFEQGKNGKYGAMYVGFNNLYPQGGMNEVGLVFDGFTQSYKPLENSEGKIKISPSDLEKKIMQECSTVEEVKVLINKYNIDFWAGATMRYIDKSGKYLLVDGDDLIIGNDNYFVQTNKRTNETNQCWRYKKANEILNKGYTSDIQFTENVMRQIVMDERSVKTLYSTIYDLNNGKIYLYYFSDFESTLVFDLKEELKKENRILNIPELFPNNNQGEKYLNEYNKILGEIMSLGNNNDRSLSYNNLKKDIFNSFIDHYPFFYKIFHTAQYYLFEEIDYDRAILLLKLNIEIYPEYFKAYDDLGDAYMESKNYDLAIENYNKSIKLNPENIKTKRKIEIILEENKK
ncbi:tetratricopeptide repeat protein [Ancylomarina longa]|uniref:Tetratricopeptide repeat protein n=1 Tax=Ancylomarina longa TaxID=2487017 RepID=A0A434AEP6_9BACT|nr:tetratricopeptide repeat protein [Ancylomarina longa]RUT72849.1 tetratricopeptide repeat protein [Ancylomarina longa]